MATKVPSSVLDRESPAKGFATKPLRFSRLYGICKRGIIYFYLTVNQSIQIIFAKIVRFTKFAMRYIIEIYYSLYSLVHEKRTDFWTVKKINNTYYKERVVGTKLIMRRIVLNLRILLYVIQPLLFHSSTIFEYTYFMRNVFYM